MSRAVVTLLAVFVVVATTSAARTREAAAAPEETPTTACVDAHQSAQRDRRDHRLLAARAKLLTCGQSTCPTLIRSDCATWLAEVEASLPSLVVDPRTPGGAPPSDWRVFVDGAPAPDAADGKAIDVDPGRRVVRVEAAGLAPWEQTVLVVEGQRTFHLVATLAPAHAPNANDAGATGAATAVHEGHADRRVPVLTYVLGAVGVAGLATFAGFGAAGVVRKGHLDDLGCRPHCDADYVHATTRDFVVADVGLVVGLAAFAVAGAVYLLDGRSAPRSAARR